MLSAHRMITINLIMFARSIPKNKNISYGLTLCVRINYLKTLPTSLLLVEFSHPVVDIRKFAPCNLQQHNLLAYKWLARPSYHSRCALTSFFLFYNNTKRN